MAGLWFETALLPGGWAFGVRLEVAEGRIRSVEVDVPPAPGDERHGIALPGLCNLHSHAFQRAMAGLTETRADAGGDSFWTWRAMMYRFVDRIEPEHIEAIAAQAYVEMLEAGFVRVAEFHYLHHARDGGLYDNIAEHAAHIGAAAEQTGIALTLLPVFYAHANFGSVAPDHGQRRFTTTPEQFGCLMDACRRAIARLPGAVLGLAPHSLRAATVGEIAAILPLCQSGPIHIHIAEQSREVDDCLAWCGRRPVEHLLDNMAVDESWCLIHATHMTAGETARLAASGAVAGLCPITEANLGDGIFPARDYAAAGGRFGVGSDSNILIDAAGELRQLEYSQRLASGGRNLLTTLETRSSGRRLFDAARHAGARASGIAAAEIAPGHPADLVSLNLHDTSLSARRGDALLDSWIFAARHGLVDCVWLQGRKLVSQGHHHLRDGISSRFRRTLGVLTG
nr:formimidoylglutamate deiminase [uncultured Rhodopila sp.]